MLAAAGQRGRADPGFLAWFTLELLELVEDGLATVLPETMRARGRADEAARVRITNDSDMIAGLVGTGLAAAQREVITAGSKTAEAVNREGRFLETV